MSEEFITKFVNSEIMTQGGNAEAIDVTIGKKKDTASTISTASLFSWVKGIYSLIISMNSSVNTINTNTVRGTVKNVQRGAGTINRKYDEYATITISPVNPAKCTVNLYGAPIIQKTNIYDTDYRESSPYVSSLTSTTLKVGAVARTNTVDSQQGLYSGTFSWEIVEYY